MRIIAISGYYGSGSSAVTDLMKEYTGVSVPKGGNYELSFFFGYHGIPNLFYWIVRGRRLQANAIRDFMRDAERLGRLGRKMNYEKYFNDRFAECTEKYIEKISGVECGLRYVVDLLSLSKAKFFIFRILNKAKYISNDLYSRFHTDVREEGIRIFGKWEKIRLYDIDEADFIFETKNYFIDLFKEYDQEKPILVDGLVATNDLDEISKYFDDIRYINVRRDPRDIYLLDKYVWKTGVVPRDVNDFCKWFITRMNTVHYSTSNVLNIRFEDMIFDYHNTIKTIENFLEVNCDTHKNINQYFNPDISKNNTRMWLKYPDEAENVSVIERNLAKWLYSQNQAEEM